MPSSPLFSILIVNYNGKAHLAECLDSLRAQSFKDFEVVLVDNASRDGSTDFLKAEYPEVKVAVSDKNRGFSGGNNFGLPHCRGEFIYFLNNDVRVDPEALAELAAAVKAHPQVGIFASFLINYKDPTKVDSAGDQVYTCGKGFSFSGYPVSLFKEPRHLTAACAGAAAFARRVLDRVGAFDEDFFLNFEDLDLSFRCQHAGEKILFIPSSKVFHKGSASLGGKKSALSLYYQERNYLMFILKNWPLPDLIRLIPGILFVKAWGLMDCLRFGQMKSWARGNRATLALIPGALRKRKAIVGNSKLGPGEFRALLRKNWLREKIAFFRGRFDLLG